MRNKLAYILGTLLLLTSFTGCIWLVVGGVGALGGYAISPDTIEGTSHIPRDELWDAAGKVLSIMGTVTLTDKATGEIDALIQGAKVKVTLIPLGKSNTTLRVKARKTLVPKMPLAQEVYVKILEYMDE